MLLCVTATSMAAAAACTPAPQPVGIVGRPDYREPEAGAAEDAIDASAPVTADATPAVADAGRAGKAGGGFDASTFPSPHPDRVGTTANVNDDVSPTVGTTARVPDKKK